MHSLLCTGTAEGERSRSTRGKKRKKKGEELGGMSGVGLDLLCYSILYPPVCIEVYIEME